jgi:hypothetical protein
MLLDTPKHVSSAFRPFTIRSTFPPKRVNNFSISLTLVTIIRKILIAWDWHWNGSLTDIEEPGPAGILLLSLAIVRGVQWFETTPHQTIN